jgi:hypothetical protein
MGDRVSGLRAISEALADQIRDALDDVDALAVQVEPRWIVNPTPLSIDVYPGDPLRDSDSAAFDDDGAYRLTVRARINSPDFDAAYDVLISLMDDEDDLHLATAIVVDPTLGGHATDVSILPTDQSGLRGYEHPSGEGGFLGFQLSVRVFPARS